MKGSRPLRYTASADVRFLGMDVSIEFARCLRRGVKPSF
jgi:hypothetical protein